MKNYSWILLSLVLPWVATGAEEPAGKTTLALCQVPPSPSSLVCERGGAFLCVNTPPGSVREAFVILKGWLNLETSTLGTFSVVTQHEYTKQLQTLSLSSPLTETCWESNNLTAEKNFCLETNGKFALRVPLAELGPYTIFVSASRVQGGSGQVTSRVSAVVSPTLTSDVMTMEPKILPGPVPAGTGHVKVTLDLLEGCRETKEACDFIGAGTHGLFVTVDNQISGVSSKSVRCETNVSQGGAGKFIVGVPVEVGRNQFDITVCNAATGFDRAACPKIRVPAFEVGGPASQIDVLPPMGNAPALWDSSLPKKMPLQFRVVGLDQKTCDDSVQVSLNLQSPQNVCLNAQGLYEVPLTPEWGYNVALIRVKMGEQKLEKTVPFGWGKPMTALEEPTLPKALQFSFSNRFFNKTLLPVVNKYLSSPDFKTWLVGLSGEMGQKPSPPNGDPTAKEQEALIRELGYCPVGKGLGALRIKITKPPQIGKINLGGFQFQENNLKIPLEGEDVTLGIQIYKDENGDGQSDIDPLPLKIGFKRVQLVPTLQATFLGGKAVWKLTSPHTDCDYKREGACFHFPALLVPKQFQGNATAAGAFAACDTSQRISAEMDEICHALNVVDRQTGGVLQEKILDAINSAYACQGTASLTTLFRKGISFKKQTEWFGLEGNVSVDDLKIRDAGLLLSLATRFGNKETLKGGAAMLVPLFPPQPLERRQEEGISMGLFLPLVSQLFWGLTGPGGGDFSLTIDEEFFKRAGFDFDSQCAVGGAVDKKPNPLCSIRPRAQEIFDYPIIESKYLEADAPLTLVLTPSRTFPLRVSALDRAGLLRIELADWELSIRSETSSMITAKLAMKIAAQVATPSPTSKDPDHFHITLKLVQAGSMLWLTEKEGTNITVIPGSVLLSNLQGKLRAAINNFSQEGKAIEIDAIPRWVSFPPGSLFSNLGFGELSWGPNGFELGWDPANESLLFQFSPTLGN